MLARFVHSDAAVVVLIGREVPFSFSSCWIRKGKRIANGINNCYGHGPLQCAYALEDCEFEMEEVLPSSCRSLTLERSIQLPRKLNSGKLEGHYLHYGSLSGVLSRVLALDWSSIKRSSMST